VSSLVEAVGAVFQAAGFDQTRIEEAGSQKPEAR